MRERRRSGRFPISGTVHLDMEGRSFELPLADISDTGVGTLLDIALLGAKPDGRVGQCIIESIDLACPVAAFVSVMRIRNLGSKHLVGLRFESISDEHLHVVRAYETLAKIRERKSRSQGPALVGRA
jgi:PilZ domain